jgi:hypothetical protein
MLIVVITCARCTETNHPSTRYCLKCGLPLGSMLPDAGAGADALGPYEIPEPADLDATRAIRDLVARSGFEGTPSGHGWRMVVPLHLDRRQAVYAGYAGTDADQRPIVSLVSISGPANDRDARILLKLNARSVEGHFAIKTLRGEDYFVVIQNLAVDQASRADAPSLVRRIAESADELEDRMSRGRDLY